MQPLDLNVGAGEGNGKSNSVPPNCDDAQFANEVPFQVGVNCPSGFQEALS